MERVTGIEPAWPAWKASVTRSRLSVKMGVDLRISVFDLDRCGPYWTPLYRPYGPATAPLCVFVARWSLRPGGRATSGCWEARDLVCCAALRRGVVARLVLRMNGCCHRVIRSDAPVLAPRSGFRTQGDLLAMVLLHPDQEWTVSDLARQLGIALTTAQSEVGRLAGGGVLATRKVGRSRVVRANLSSPSVPPLTQLTLVTFGPQTVVGDEFAGLDADRVVVFGSWAARYHGEKGDLPADIDVLVVGDGIDRVDLYDAPERAEARLRMPVKPRYASSGLMGRPR